MSFASDVRNEICKTDITEVCCARAELAGMVCFGTVVKNREIKMRTENECVAKRFYDLIYFLYNIKIDITSSESGFYNATLSGDEVIKIMRDMNFHFHQDVHI